MSKIIFSLSLFSLFYAYFGYPLLMRLLAKIKSRKPVDKKQINPFVSLVIPAYNEEKNISAKLNDIIDLDYPKEKIEVFVVSDASSDKTDEIVRGFADKGIKLFRLQEQSGKIDAYRKVFPYLKGEIIVFSDATSLLTNKSITNLINNFHDKSVGCAGGLLQYINPKQAMVGKGERTYWDYEKKIRALESELCSLTSVSGTLYAVRKELYPLNMKNYLADDLLVPFAVKKAGYRTILEPQAICYDYTTLSIKEEMAKRTRITVQNIRGLLDQPDILNPFKFGLFSLLVISHKLFRLLVPLFLFGMFVSTLLLSFQSWQFSLLLLSQGIFYAGALYCYPGNEKFKLRMGKYLFYFCLSNWAILIGMFKYLKGQKFATWETVRA